MESEHARASGGKQEHRKHLAGEGGFQPWPEQKQNNLSVCPEHQKAKP